ncbi:Histone-lysine N-methyltransferase prdm9 [Desmophyllum pertusum]|uniref:Histone-lysine N-methyltransferase prdm9 n=1 Tax=Desmophyllum pertusum TaxID=174260 RepID=A0A9X0A671_9CNID|nr:Histone-lysine N-methyltransferase prdm9 [Desmophyllum pertusum]
MAYVLSQMPVHCGPVQLLKEPDVLPKFKYLFENEHRPTTKEDPEMTFNVEPQVNSEGEQLLDVDSCEKSVANSDVKPELNSDEEDVIVIDPVPINPCEDPETTSEVKTQVKSDDIIRQLTIDGLIIMSSTIIDVVSREGRETTLDVKTLVNSEEGVIDIVSNCEEFKTNYDIKPDVSSEEKGIDVVPCKESKTNCDVKPEVSSEEEDIIEVVSCEELTVNHVDIPEENHSREEVTAPVPCKDFEEPVVISDDGATPKCKPRIQEISIPLEKLRVTTNCINKRLELEEDEYIFCSQCDKLRIGDCSIHGSLRWQKEPAVVFKKEGLTKARSTIPSNMDLKTSSIPDAGLGIFAKERFESDVVFGPYGGEKIDVADVAPNMDQSYMWDIIENGRVTHVVDARDEKHSNWLRFVNCARNDDEQNLVAFQFRGEIYYRSYKAIEPGTELLVWYGDKYACDLDILNKDESKKIADGPIQCQKCFMVCSGPFSFANHNKFRCQMNSEHHLWRCMHCDRSFKTQFSLHLHQNIHKGLRPFTCRICGKGFSHPSSRNRHYNLHFAKHPLHCKMCVQGFGDKNSLRRHERTFHAFKRLSDGKFECLECQKLFGTWKSLRQHKKHVRHTDADASNCKANSKLFKKRQNFLRHEALHKPYKCQQCGLFFLSRIGLSNHKRSHLNKTVNESKTRCQNGLTTAHYVCQICRSGFKYSQNLDRHIRQKHPSVKGIKCRKCSKVCLDKHRLALHNAIRHARNDSRLKTHRLQQEQGNKQGLVDSKARVNMDATIQRAESENAMETSEGKYLASSNHPQDQTVFNSKEFRCEFCAKCFPSLSLMHRHRASHFRKKHPMLHVPVSFGMSSMVPPKETPRRDGTVCSKRKFKCEVCCKSFSSSKGLHSHRGSHFRRKNCEHCNKSFYTMKLLRQHNCCRVDNSPNSTTFHCKVCNKSFLKETSLLSHMTHHSRNPSPSSSVLPPPSPLPKCSPESSKLQAEDKSFKCDICAREFISKKSLNSHKSYHTRCGEKWFPSSRAWQQRQKSPHGQGSFSFSSRPSDSKKSVLSASDQKQFRCEVCGKGFCFRESLNRHKGQHSKACTKQSFPSHRFSKKTKPNVDGTFRCKVCKKSFLKETSLRSHMTHHSRNPSQSPPPNSLPKCSPEFSKLQAEDKSFKCDICAREFVSKDSLNAHKSHHARFGNKWFLSSPLLQPRRKSPHGQGS